MAAFCELMNCCVDDVPPAEEPAVGVVVVVVPVPTGIVVIRVSKNVLNAWGANAPGLGRAHHVLSSVNDSAKSC